MLVVNISWTDHRLYIKDWLTIVILLACLPIFKGFDLSILEKVSEVANSLGRFLLSSVDPNSHF